MTVLVADVGGTNARLGLANDGVLHPNSVKRFSNVDFATFYDVINNYLSDQSNLNLSTCVVALAGPVSSTQGRLTNREWLISTDKLMTTANCPSAILMNDLSSLGYSLQGLAHDGLTMVSPGSLQTPNNSQSLVVGIGTGFNVCPVKLNLAGRPTCLQAEAGHVAMPPTVLHASTHPLGDRFNLVEDLFSGRGITHLYQEISGKDPLAGSEIAKRYADRSDETAIATMELFANLLGKLTRELVLSYMPLGGIYFAGSVARGIFDAGLGPIFCDAMYEDTHFLPDIRGIPVRVIDNDAAGLIGCAIASQAA